MSPKFRVNPDRYDIQDREKEQESEYSEFDYETITTDCPLCREYGELDFHHWVYPPQDVIGTHICRDCHLSIHSSEGARPSESDDWVQIAISELVDLWVDIYPWVSADFLSHKFSIPQKFHAELSRSVDENTDRVDFVGWT